MDRNLKVKIHHFAKAMRCQTSAGHRWRTITPTALIVLDALLWRFHNAKSGLCFPSYETIAKACDCSRSAVADAVKLLERAGILTWVNRIYRAIDRLGLVRVRRTTNGYRFCDLPPTGAQLAPVLKSSKSEVRMGKKRTKFQELITRGARAALGAFAPNVAALPIPDYSNSPCAPLSPAALAGLMRKG